VDEEIGEGLGHGERIDRAFSPFPPHLALLPRALPWAGITSRLWRFRASESDAFSI
jgi:hypothetical protein